MTYGTMQDRIADELDRTDMTTQIQRAIKSAIKAYEQTRFWFNESRSFTFSTVDGQEFYTSSDNSDIPSILAIDTVQLAISGSDKYLLERVSYEEIEATSANGTADEGQPTWFCYYNKELRLYPIPDAVYTVRVSGVWSLSDLSLTTDTNNWMTNGEILIRQRAKRIIYTDVILDPEAAQIAATSEKEEFRELIRGTNFRSSTGKLVATDF
jgi:hypothetical protein